MSKIPDEIDYAILICFSNDMTSSRVDISMELKETLALYRGYKFSIEDAILNTHSKIVIDIKVISTEKEELESG